MENFPRKLTELERELLFSILPSDKPGYIKYRKKIENKYVIGIGRFGETNLILGNRLEKINIQDASSSIFAAGSIIYDEGKIEISINEEIDDKIEFDISPKDYELVFKSEEIKRWNYSEWIPGHKSPKEKSNVREIVISPGKHLLVISAEEKRIWLHESESGINYLIPLSNYYNQLMIEKNIRDPKIALKPNLFFEDAAGKHSDYTDIELRNSFLSYNKYLKKLDIKQEIIINKTKNKRKFLKFLKG
ncbi:MAG: hypothetical protein P8Z35_15930 [Ignavibacteriaceae bacterium]